MRRRKHTALVMLSLILILHSNSCVTCPEEEENQITLNPVALPSFDGVYYDAQLDAVIVTNEAWKQITDYFVDVDSFYKEINTIQKKIVIKVTE